MPFIPGLQLAGEFYAEVVRPLLADEYPGLRYSSGLLGPGSEVLDAGRFTAALLEAIADPRIRQLSAVGAIDQFVDSTDALSNVPLLRAIGGTVNARGVQRID
jgi:hypothetical protein